MMTKADQLAALRDFVDAGETLEQILDHEAGVEILDKSYPRRLPSLDALISALEDWLAQARQDAGCTCDAGEIITCPICRPSGSRRES